MAERAQQVWLSRLLAIGLGLGLVVVLELLLRLWPGLAPPPLVVDLAECEGRVLRSVNSRYAERFFSERYQGQLIASGRMAACPFVEPRPAEAFRVVFVGASTVQGYPQPRRLVAPSFLEAMLRDALPGRQVQVFNLGITSIASFAVGRVLEDAMALAWGDSAEAKTAAMAPVSPLRSKNVHDLLKRIIVAERDSLLQNPSRRRLSVPLTDPIVPKPEPRDSIPEAKE